MDTVLAHAEIVLQQSPAAAMALTELHGRVRSRNPVGMPTPAAFRKLLESAHRRFRVLDPWEGPPPLGHATLAQGAGDHVLVISLRPPNHAGSARVELQLRDSVRWMAGAADVRSARGSARAYSLVAEGTAAQRRLTKRAA